MVQDIDFDQGTEAKPLTMLILDSPSTDPYFNVAAEEYLLKEKEDDYVFIYVNEPSIIIGKHQNAYAEINLPYVLEKKLPVVRRISGGGTVWHDLGNVNFSFILNGEEGQLVNFRQYASPVLSYLQGLRIPAEFGSRNELLAAGEKISGNAEHVYRSRVLHHGTLLFSSDLHAMRTALGREPGKYSDRAVQSVPSPVVNLGDFLSPGMDTSMFRKNLLDHLSGAFEDSQKFVLSQADLEQVNGLVSRKYSTWEWNIGYSPKYRMNREAEWDGRKIRIQLEVEKGKILGISITSDDADHELLDRLSRILEGADHEPGQIQQRIWQSGLVNPRQIDNFMKAIF